MNRKWKAVGRRHEGFREARGGGGFVALQTGNLALWSLFPVVGVRDGWVAHVELADGTTADVRDIKRSAYQPYASDDDFTDLQAVRERCWISFATHSELIETVREFRRAGFK